MSKKLSYWERRKAQLIFNQMDKAEKQADSFDAIYNEANRYLTRQSNKVFDKFQRDYGLTEKEARLVLKTIKDDKTIDNLKRQLQAQPDNPNINQLLADLDSPAFAFRINRFNDLQKQIDNISNKVYQSEKQQSDTYYSDFMNDSYYHHTYELQKRLGVAYDFNTLPEREISRLQRSNWYGDNYSSRIWNNTQALADSLKNELLIGLMTGRSTRDIAEIISQRFDVGKNASRRLVRTESAYYHGQMELKSYDEADISQYQFVATLDLRTSTICREHDQMVYKTKEAAVGVNYPPMHPWCRSTTIAYFDDKWAKGKKRRAKDPKTGKNILVPADMTYDDWYAKHVKPLYKVDGLKQSDIDRANQQYIKYKHILGDEKVPKTLADFVDLKYNNVKGYKELKDRVIWGKAEFPSEKSFNGHFKSHGSEFANISKEQYQKAAASLLAEPVSEDILGYETDNRRVRYDYKNNIYVLGNPKTKRITTMFRPKGGKEYYDGEVSKDLGN